MAFILLQSFVVHSSEIDSYSRFLHLRSATRHYDATINTWIAQAVYELNEDRVECPRDAQEAKPVYNYFKREMASPFIGHSIAVHFDENLPENMISQVSLERSIYGTIEWLEGFSLNLKGLLGITKSGRNRIGVDKLGHFFVEGFGFFKRAYIRNEASLKKAVEWGKFTERTYFGMTTTGVYSHADLVANYNGMRFWNQLFLFEKDPVSKHQYGYISKPMLSCKEGVWKLNSKFTLRKYIDRGWDESSNCNSYETEEIEDKVIKSAGFRLGHYQLEKSGGRICPLVERSCSREIIKYGEFAKDLLHGSCFDKELEYTVNPDRFNIYPRISNPFKWANQEHWQNPLIGL